MLPFPRARLSETGGSRGMVADDIFKDTEEEVSLTTNTEGTARRKSWPATMHQHLGLQSSCYRGRLNGVQNQIEGCVMNGRREPGIFCCKIRLAKQFNQNANNHKKEAILRRSVENTTNLNFRLALNCFELGWLKLLHIFPTLSLFLNVCDT